MKFARTLLASVAVGVAMLGTAQGEAGGEEKYQFESETSRLLDILIHSLYSNKDVFLRELVSNAVDALDKLRFLSVEAPEMLEGNEDLDVRISFDDAERTLTIRDSGIGMTKEDLIMNLGTVAKSGTTQFVEAMASQKSNADLNLIGQFGVGFYAAFLVADKVQVTSKHQNDDQHVWTSTADSSFTVVKDDSGNTLGRGTEIKLFLKEDAIEYTNQDKLEGLVKQYSEFAQFPIYLRKSKTEMVEVEDEEDEEDESEDGEDGVEDEEEDDDEEEEEEEEDSPKTKEVTTWSWERVNNQNPIWTRSKEDVKDEEYQEFYKSISKDYADALTWTHFRAEGEVEFSSILYVPSVAPPGIMQDYYNTKANVKLYVRKVLIADDLEDLLPKYMNFIKGMVDSNDLPLKVDREGLQQSKVLKVIGKKLTRKVLETLRKMSEAEQRKLNEEVVDEDIEDDDDEDDDEEAPSYSTFWKAFSKNVKLGVIEDQANRNKLVKLLRFKTSASLMPSGDMPEDSELISLETYVSRMQDWQKDIYYLAGTNMDELVQSPFLERARAKGVEVLMMDDALDEYLVQQVPEFETHKLQSLAKEGLKFGDETEDDKKREKLYKKTYKPLVDYLQNLLEDKIEKAVVSNRVTDTPAVLVSSQFGYSANMEKIMKHQAFGSGSNPMMMMSKRILELNPRSPIVADLQARVESDPDAEETSDLARVLFDMTLLNSGFDIEAKKDFSKRMQRILKVTMQLDSLDLLPEIEVPEDDEAEEEAAASVEEVEEEKVEL
ncbi:Heat shock protein 90 [Hondaea fermentalgiana]|uniref:Heat shock protein 90 n=1 Tax=Hondaea fermentalgiana TaxID=2315210 RepID=A0A2R5GWV4_9STRA|nr:Heat shock protein 90 [Hondaea fermentalgiana]|eukprot:GBG33153.1 Heat shock protein 90 [Hondaea fermentalgiana]